MASDPVARSIPASRIGLGVGLFVAVVGAGLWLQTGRAPLRPPPLPPPPDVAVVVPAHDDELAPVALTSGVRGPAVVNVWLQGCSDCMPAFEAWRDIAATGALRDVYVVNVAYGSATRDFARRYGVDEHLVADPDGSHVVERFGIGTFTTLVLDAEGHETLRARPTDAGYVTRVTEAWRRVSRR